MIFHTFQTNKPRSRKESIGLMKEMKEKERKAEKTAAGKKEKKEKKKDRYVGISKVGEKGQIVIPKEARDMFDIAPGDSLVLLCDRKKGIALVKADVVGDFADNFLPKEQGNAPGSDGEPKEDCDSL